MPKSFNFQNSKKPSAPKGGKGGKAPMMAPPFEKGAKKK